MRLPPLMLKDRIVSMCVGKRKRKKRIAKEKLVFLVLLLECSLGICMAVWFSCGKDNMLADIAGGKSRVPLLPRAVSA